MNKYKCVLIKIGIVLVILLILLIIWICASRDSSSDFVVYEHDKLYAKYIEANSVEWEPLGETEKVEVDILVENEYFSVSRSKSVNRVSVLISDKSSGKTYWGESPILGVDESGNTVCTFAAGGGCIYYNPFTKEFESGIRFVEITEDKLVFDVLLIQDFFSSDSYNSHMPRFMTIEDFESFSEAVDYDLNNSYKLTNAEDMLYEDYVRLFGEDENGISGVKMNMFLSDFYLKRTLSKRDGTDYLTPEEKRQCESKFVKKGCSAPMALARFTIDISGEELTYNSELIKVISPKNSSVVDIVPALESAVDY